MRGRKPPRFRWFFDQFFPGFVSLSSDLPKDFALKKSAEISVLVVPIDQLDSARNNSRRHSDEQVSRTESSIREFGWTKPILIDDMEIVAGHGACEAALRIDRAGDLRHDALNEGDGWQL